MATRQVIIVGTMTSPDDMPQPPLGIWGPTDPRPTNPIAGIPGLPGYQPPLSIWGPPGPWPTPPIANVPPFSNPNPPGEGGGSAEPKFQPAWSPYYGWVMVPQFPLPTPSQDEPTTPPTT